MIKVEYCLSEDKHNIILKVKGHAGQAEEGRDLICASASTLAYQMAQLVGKFYVLGWLRKEPTIKMLPGESLVVAKPLKAKFNQIMFAYQNNQVGFEILAYNFPEYVSLKKFDVDSLKAN